MPTRWWATASKKQAYPTYDGYSNILLINIGISAAPYLGVVMN
jgi:hypothetical protein